MGCALGSLAHSQARVKISAGSAPQGPKYSLSKNLTWGVSTCAPITFLCVDESSPNFLCHTWEGVLVITPFSACRYLHPFRRYSSSKCEVAQNRTKFRTVFALPNFKGAGPPQNCTHLIMPASRHVTCKSLVRLLPLTPKLQERTPQILSQFLNVRC